MAEATTPAKPFKANPNATTKLDTINEIYKMQNSNMNIIFKMNGYVDYVLFFQQIINQK